MTSTLRRLTGDIAAIVIPVIDAPDDPDDVPAVVSALAAAGAPTYEDVAAAQADGWDVVGEVMGDDSVVVFLRHREGVAALGDTSTSLALTA